LLFNQANDRIRIAATWLPPDRLRDEEREEKRREDKPSQAGKKERNYFADTGADVLKTQGEINV